MISLKIFFCYFGLDLCLRVQKIVTKFENRCIKFGTLGHPFELSDVFSQKF